MKSTIKLAHINQLCSPPTIVELLMTMIFFTISLEDAVEIHAFYLLPTCSFMMFLPFISGVIVDANLMLGWLWMIIGSNQPTPRTFHASPEYRQWMKLYGNEITGPIDTTRYTARDFTKGLIIDITADQFGKCPVYVGPRNDFYRRFTFHSAYTCNGVHECRLNKLYRKIAEFLP